MQRYINEGIVPIVEDHMATSQTDAASLQSVVDRWLLPDNLAWLKQYERQVILNIANEWGPDSTVWRDQYEIAIESGNEQRRAPSREWDLRITARACRRQQAEPESIRRDRDDRAIARELE